MSGHCGAVVFDDQTETSFQVVVVVGMQRYSQRCKESMPFIVQHEKMTIKQNHAPFWQGH